VSVANPNELRKARNAANRAVATLRWIEDLPRRKGESVQWRNGVIWTRAGDDDWRAHTSPDVPTPSSHVAMYQWELANVFAQEGAAS